MKLLSAVEALGLLCMVLAEESPVPMDESPKIIGRNQVNKKAHLGQKLQLSCKAFANDDEDLTVIYWLINGSFPEDMHSNGRIVESEESSLQQGAILQRSLLLKSVTAEDLKSTFTCVVTNSAGRALKHIKLSASGSVGSVKKSKKH